MVRAVVAALLLALACASAQTYVYDVAQPQKSVPYNVMFNGFQGVNEVIPPGDPLVAFPNPITATTPYSIHVELAEGLTTGSVWISWTTGNDTLLANPAEINQSAPGANPYIDDYPQAPAFNFNPKYPDPASVASVVQWGTQSGVYTSNNTGMARGYIQTAFFQPFTQVSQLFHHVHVTGIPYGQKVGDPAQGLSPEQTLMLNTSTQPYTKNYPVTIGMMADNGVTYNSSVTYQHCVAHNPDFIMYIGDLAYADDFNPNGTDSYFVNEPQPTYALTGSTQYNVYTPQWDLMTQLLQMSGKGASIPYMFLPGNHEIEQDEQYRTFQSYLNRFRSPYEQSYSTNQLYYSLDVGPAHIIMMNAYNGPVPNLTINTNNTGQQSAAELGNDGAPLFPNGNYPYSSFGYDQFSWFLNDIARVNRALTPWVIVAWHQPPYNSYSTHYKEFECERQHIEPFLYANGVDIVMHGHVHAYERTYPINNYVVDPCGSRWITIGDGGNIEGLYKTFAAEQGTCTCAASNGDTSSNGCPCQGVSVSNEPQACATFQNFNNNGTLLWAPINASQPAYSAYREPSFGHGILELLNDTTATWTWYRNQDGEAVYSDTALFVRNTTLCPNKLKPIYDPATPPAPSVAPPAPSATPAATKPSLGSLFPLPNPLQNITNVINHNITALP